MKNQIEIKTDPAGTKYWYQNDQLHRTDGPAVEESDGTKEYWINGNQLSDVEKFILFKQKL